MNASQAQKRAFKGLATAVVVGFALALITSRWLPPDTQQSLLTTAGMVVGLISVFFFFSEKSIGSLKEYRIFPNQTYEFLLAEIHHMRNSVWTWLYCGWAGALIAILFGIVHAYLPGFLGFAALSLGYSGMLVALYSIVILMAKARQTSLLRDELEEEALHQRGRQELRNQLGIENSPEKIHR